MKTETKKLIAECERRGIQLEPSGSMLLITPEQATTPELVERIRQRKSEIISCLAAKQRAAWKHVAKQILCGEFEGADGSTRERLAVGLHVFVEHH